MRLAHRLRAAPPAVRLTVGSWLAAGPGTARVAPIRADGIGRMAIRWPEAYEWPAAAKWVDALRNAMSLRIPVTSADIGQPFEGAVMFEVAVDSTIHQVAIDYFDHARVLDAVADASALVFKMQFRDSGYAQPNVVPGGYVPGQPHLYRYLPALRRVRDRGRERFEVYGRFGLSYAPEIRRKAVTMLSEQDRFAYEGSLALRPYSAYLREAAQSRVCLDLPGNGDMCHRLVDYLAIGCCIVRPRPVTRLPAPLTDGLNVRYVREDLADLVDVCGELVADPARARAIGGAAREYFDKSLAVQRLADHYLSQCAARLTSAH